jgi:hypothetical protein
MGKLLGDVTFSKKTFAGLSSLLKGFQKKEFISMPDWKKESEINGALLRFIQEEAEPCFLLAAVLEFVEKVDALKILDHYTFNGFELWLNLDSQLSFEENYRVRSKIAGKHIDRGDYSLLFPIGLGKVFEGSHFVTAHKSPDLDTTVASFWGWLDAFAARVSKGQHIWNVPGEPPSSQIEIDWIFKDIFGPAVFTHLMKTRTTLHVTGNDLMTKERMFLTPLDEQIGQIDHDRDQNAIVLVDDQGYYLGDFRSIDVEGVREVILLLSICLRWFENHLNLHFLTIFAKEKLTKKDVAPALNRLFNLKVGECEPALEFTVKEREKARHFITRVLGIPKGLDCTFEALAAHFGKFHGSDQVLQAMEKEKLFDAKGALIEDRSRIFAYLQKAVSRLHEGVIVIRRELERLDVALKTKMEVLGHKPTFITARADVDEIKIKMESYPYLTVVNPDRDKMVPVGVVPSSIFRKNIYGTVSLRDFCNREEMGIPPYLEVISVIDHHKSILQTTAPAFAIISDAQSSNSLVARQAFLINDRNSLGGMTREAIEKQIKTEKSTHTLQRLLQRSRVAKGVYVHPEREFIEYLHFLYAIIEDTDLLTKVTPVDVECVVELLNRMKSIHLGRECEIISIDEIPRDKSFAKKAAAKILQNEEMYSLYRKVYAFREKEVEANMKLASESKPSNFFSDTKEQNGCCRIGQTKCFVSNISHFEKKGDAIRKAWIQMAEKTTKEKPEIQLHIHMISTIVNAEEVYRKSRTKYAHKDELWIWIPPKEEAIELLEKFLSAFQSSLGLQDNPLEVEFLGDNAKVLEGAFKESFLPIPMKKANRKLPIAVLRFNPGSLNSRKSMVSPYLPTIGH